MNIEECCLFYYVLLMMLTLVFKFYFPNQGFRKLRIIKPTSLYTDFYMKWNAPFGVRKIENFRKCSVIIFCTIYLNLKVVIVFIVSLPSGH